MVEEREGKMLAMRETQVLKYAAQGHTNKGIASKLGISEGTVKTYWSRVRLKLGAFSRTQLVARYLTAQADVSIKTLRAQNEQLQQAVNTHRTREAPRSGGVEAEFEKVLVELQEALILTDRYGRISFVNQEAEVLIGYGSEEVLGRHIGCLVARRLREAHHRIASEFVRTHVTHGAGEHFLTTARNKDGRKFRIAATLKPIATPYGLRVSCLFNAYGGPAPC